MGELFKLYCEWIDDSIFDGLNYDEADDLEEELTEKYGVPHILRKDAPPEAVEAWKEDCRISKKARTEGNIID